LPEVHLIDFTIGAYAMIATIVSGGFKAVVWGLAVAGFAGVALAGMIAWPLRQPAELASISESRKWMDFNTLPAVDRFQARDGTVLAYRRYPARGAPIGRIAILVHGSSGSSRRRWRRGAWRITRWTFAAMANPARAATSVTSASLRTTWPISSRKSVKSIPPSR
jgi:hypothetical protein